MGWISYLFAYKRRPFISRHLTTPFDIETISEDDLLVLMAGRARDPQYVQWLMRKHKATTTMELLQKLPRRRRTPFRQRLRSLIARWEGALPYDPIRRDLRTMRHEARPNGVRRVKMR